MVFANLCDYFLCNHFKARLSTAYFIRSTSGDGAHVGCGAVNPESGYRCDRQPWRELPTTSPGVEMTAVEMEEKINIGEENTEVGTVTGIPGNHGVSSSSEPSTVGAGVASISAVPTAVQVSQVTA